MKTLLYILIPSAIVIAIVILFWKRYKSLRSQMQKKSANTTTATEDKTRQTPYKQDYPTLKRQLKKLFAHQFAKIEDIISEMGNIYNVPCYLLIGQSGAGKSQMMQNSGIGFPLDAPTEIAKNQPCTFWITNQGLVIEAKGGINNQIYAKQFYTLILRLMKRYRRRRPFDGVIFALPYTELTDKADRPIDNKNIQYQALFSELQRFKSKSRLKLPIYVVITHSDKIPGFSALTKALSDQDKAQLFGWSNPESPDVFSEKNQAKIAINSITHTVKEMALGLLARHDDMADKDNVIQLDQTIAAIAPTLSQYCRALTASNVYSQESFLRGVYFTAAPNRNDAAFIYDLFVEKIFKEYKVATPDMRYTIFQLKRSSPWVRYTPAVLVILGVLGLWIGSNTISEKAAYIETMLEKENLSMDKAHATMSKPDQWKIGNDEIELLKFWSKSHRLSSLFLPSSWLNPLNDRLRFIESTGADTIILLSIKRSLLDKLLQILETPIPDVKPLTYKQYLDFIQFQLLNNFVDRSLQLEMYMRIYNNLKGTNNRLSISKNQYIALTRFALGEQASGIFVKTIKRLDSTLEYVTIYPFPIQEKIKQRLSVKLARIARYSSEQAFNSWPLSLDAIDLNNGLNEIYQQQANLQTLQRIYDEIREINDYLDIPPGIRTNYPDYLSPWQNFNKPMLKAKQSDLFVTQIVEELADQVNTETNQKLKNIEKLNNPLFGKLFNFDTLKDRVLLTPEIKVLENIIRYFLDQNFVTEKPNVQIKLSGNIEWNTTGLNKAIQFLEQYIKFQSILKEQKDPILQIQAQKLGQIVTDNELENLIFNAFDVTRSNYKGTLVSASELRAEALNLQDNMDQLLKLASKAKALGLPGSTKLLKRLFNHQADYLLKNASRILYNDELYQPNISALQSWDGEQPLAAVIYDASTPAAIQYYLNLQRQRILFLANFFARPALRIRSVYSPASSSAPPLSKDTESLNVINWKSIIAQIDKFNNKNPNSSLLSLENFISKDLNTINLQNCYEKLTINDESLDFFALIESSLKTKIRQTCRAMVNKDLVDGYAKLSKAFNRNLGGRFPFAQPSKAAFAPAVPFQTVLNFFYDYGNFITTNIELLSRITNLSVQERSVLDFLKRLDASFKFLLAKNNGWYQEPRYVVEAFFRVNRRAEIDGNQIAGWRLIVDEQTVTPSDKKKTLIWQYGDPLRVNLRWASNSPYLPMPIVGKPNTFTQGKTVSYSYKGSWALLRFLVTQRAFNPVFVPVPYQSMVKLVNLVYTDNQAGSAPKMAIYPKVVVYMGFNLTSAVDGKKAILPNFPWRAPALNRQTPYIK